MKKVQIKKYENRRFYSSSEKRYVTLTEIQKLITSGQSVQIIENETENDITSEVLTQILLENGGFKSFPPEVLEQLIKMNDAALFSMWGQFVGQSFHYFMQMQNDMTKAYTRFFAAFAKKRS